MFRKLTGRHSENLSLQISFKAPEYQIPKDAESRGLWPVGWHRSSLHKLRHIHLSHATDYVYASFGKDRISPICWVKRCQFRDNLH